ncbi:MAG: DUF721 domain-containing protein [Bacteroidales bacterium]|nr:DUF721 domain-containing protein [Bacteroidales bacterium]
MTRIARKYPQQMADVIGDFIKELKLSNGVNVRCIFKAWDEVSCASRYTSGRNFRDGILYITLSSSVVRSALSFQTDAMAAAMNEKLSKDTLFVREAFPDENYVKKIVLR